MNTLRQERLVDDLVDAYIDWRETCHRVHDAYRAWTRETTPPARVAFELYTTALNAEQRAAETYATLISAG